MLSSNPAIRTADSNNAESKNSSSLKFICKVALKVPGGAVVGSVVGFVVGIPVIMEVVSDGRFVSIFALNG